MKRHGMQLLHCDHDGRHGQTRLRAWMAVQQGCGRRCGAGGRGAWAALTPVGPACRFLGPCKSCPTAVALPRPAVLDMLAQLRPPGTRRLVCAGGGRFIWPSLCTASKATGQQSGSHRVFVWPRDWHAGERAAAACARGLRARQACATPGRSFCTAWSAAWRRCPRTTCCSAASRCAAGGSTCGWPRCRRRSAPPPRRRGPRRSHALTLTLTLTLCSHAQPGAEAAMP